MAPSHDPTYPLFPVFSFLGFFLTLIPLPWHIQAWNSGTCAFMIWTGMTCLIEFTNSLVWRGNVNNVAPIWCDISSKLILGVSVGIPAATLCISRRLYTITSVQTVSVTRDDKRRMIIGDLCIAVGIPVLIMILHVVVQPHRFDILEDIGCFPAVYNTLPAYFLYFMWPPLLAVVSLVYSALTLRSFWIRRMQFNQLISSKTSMNPGRYLRLMLLALIDMVCSIPLSVYSIYGANKGVGLAPWISWEDTHFNFGRIAFVPAIFWRSDPSFQTSVEMTRWLPVFCAFLFFGLFGFASEARNQYINTFWWVAKRIGISRPLPGTSIRASLPGWKKAPALSPSSAHGSLPVYTPRSPLPKKRHRADSLSSSLAGDEHELSTYVNLDIEKSAGLSSTTSFPPPPSYYRPQPHDEVSPSSEAGLSCPPSPQLSRARLDPQPSMQSLRTVDSSDRIYISEAFYESVLVRTRTPSPAPFSDVIPAPFHRPFTPPNLYPMTLPHPGTQSLDAIRVTVHTQSQSTDAL
ncbi:Pheromone B alpha 2 receptor [Hypsizygus marmoreus]|uniref:Pheromone B alpha 2 receptor n=1 Tax=Hypsizygus marmoreus TaxID=39966 RepID=A0A369JAB6_HYPMA|nr:Pheromone B alpha 2 receptor [Hypsizygus marmoreus]